jgi:muramoyltetrapeptide carboxypeptidase
VPAPASPYHNRSQVERAVRLLESFGYRVKLAEHIAAREQYLAGSAETRARDLMAMFTDPEVDAVICLQGGYGSNQVIPLLDYPVIRDNPKPFMGYSDITSLHVAIRQRTGLVTFYGPGAMSMSAPTASTSGSVNMAIRSRARVSALPARYCSRAALCSASLTR